MSLTVDASVFVSAARPGEVHHSDSLTFVDRIDDEATEVFCPTLVLAESVAGMARTTGDTNAANDLMLEIESLPGIVLLPLTTERSRKAAQLASFRRLRGADSIYLQCAAETAATLITWDNEMLVRAQVVVPTMTPAEWLTANPVDAAP